MTSQRIMHEGVDLPDGRRLVVCLSKHGHDYHVSTVDTEDGDITKEYVGRSRRDAFAIYDGTIARLDCID